MHLAKLTLALYNDSMPAKKVVKSYETHAYYHIFNRGVDNGKIFRDDQDYQAFVQLMGRYLSASVSKDNSNRDYPCYHGELTIIAYSLLPRSFHLLVRQDNNHRAIETFMRSLVTSYSMYFNRRHSRQGHLFQGVYKASLIEEGPQLLHVSRHIHIAPKDYETWPYSSWPYYTAGWTADWLQQHRIFELFDGGDYRRFIVSYNEDNDMWRDIQKKLADK